MSDDDAYLIWSNEHHGWWRNAGRGYATGLRGAGRYSRADALSICASALYTARRIEMISEIPVRLADVDAFLKDKTVPPAVTEGAKPWSNDG